MDNKIGARRVIRAKRLKAEGEQEDARLKKAAMEFAKAWAAWHEHGAAWLDDDLVNAGHGIVEALGLEMVEQDSGRQKLVKRVKP